jgi:hypothetical protein
MCPASLPRVLSEWHIAGAYALTQVKQWESIETVSRIIKPAVYPAVI